MDLLVDGAKFGDCIQAELLVSHEAAIATRKAKPHGRNVHRI